jgi:hypothetical protein
VRRLLAAGSLAFRRRTGSLLPLVRRPATTIGHVHPAPGATVRRNVSSRSKVLREIAESLDRDEWSRRVGLLVRVDARWRAVRLQQCAALSIATALISVRAEAGCLSSRATWVGITILCRGVARRVSNLWRCPSVYSVRLCSLRHASRQPLNKTIRGVLCTEKAKVKEVLFRTHRQRSSASAATDQHVHPITNCTARALNFRWCRVDDMPDDMSHAMWMRGVHDDECVLGWL